MSMNKRAAIRLKQLETEDPLVVQLAEDGGEDMEFVEMQWKRTSQICWKIVN